MTDLEPDFPLADLAQRHGYTLAMLRTEHRKGRLKVLRIAGKLRATDSAIREMRRLCLEEQKGHDSTCDPPAPTAPLCGSFSTEEKRKAQDALKATVKALTSRSRPTSQKNTSRPAQVVSLPKH